MNFDREKFQKLAENIAPDDWLLKYTERSAYVVATSQNPSIASPDVVITPHHPEQWTIGTPALSDRAHEFDKANMQFIVECVNFVKQLLKDEKSK